MSKRKMVTFDNVSADGCFTDANGKLDWVVPNDEVTGAAMEAAPNVDAMLFGRKTFLMFEEGWRDKDVDPHSGKTTPQSREMSKWINDHLKIVFSKTISEPTWKSSRLLRDADRETIDALRNGGGGKGRTLLGTLGTKTKLALVDERSFHSGHVVLRYRRG